MVNRISAGTGNAVRQLNSPTIALTCLLAGGATMYGLLALIQLLAGP